MSSFEGLVHPSWLPALSPHENILADIGMFLRKENEAGFGYHPDSKHIFAAFQLPLPEVKVLIMGQDPYPTPGHAMGLSFSVMKHIRPLPKSLINIYKELQEDVGCAQSTSGDLSAWSNQGVMLLNRVLTVRSGDAGSHRRIGWQTITDAAICALVQRHLPLVAVLWGNDAQTVSPLLHGVATISSAHPSPLSAHRGFFGSKPFSQAHHMLALQGAAPIDWCLP